MNKYELILHEQIALDPIKTFQRELLLTESRDEFTVALYEQSLIVERSVKDVFKSAGKLGGKVGGSIKDFAGFAAIKKAVMKMLEIIKNFRKGMEVDPKSFKAAQSKGLTVLKRMANIIDMAAKNNYVNPAQTFRSISDMIKEVTEIFNDFKEIYQSIKKGYESGKKVGQEIDNAEKMGQDILKGRKLNPVH